MCRRLKVWVCAAGASRPYAYTCHKLQRHRSNDIRGKVGRIPLVASWEAFLFQCFISFFALYIVFRHHAEEVFVSNYIATIWAGNAFATDGALSSRPVSVFVFDDDE